MKVNLVFFNVLSFSLGLTLLEVKASLNDSKNFLSNWKDIDESPCNWTGIACSPQHQRVISINLPHMQLGGIIPPTICTLNKLQRLSIPNEIAHCSELRALYLGATYFQGGIPSTIGNVSMLTTLDLSSNTLKGAIPSSLGRLTRLAYLNLSSNFLSGEIPDVGVLSKFGANRLLVI
ncbi:LRR receptor-like serine/threonine-protein kinase FEI 1 [Salvia divinorum]|uniref:LRR receptor-like serine/threonine-protein kinase FEI 1 n=1 Tax=Salvia divinorum TaxID=28513 RepID=A0ABD1GKU6_SALDI